MAHNCHRKINCSRHQINFNGINTTLFHATNTFSRHISTTLFHGTNTFSRHISTTLFHGTNTFSRHKHSFTAQTLFHGTNTFSRHKQFFTAQTLFRGTNTFSRHNHKPSSFVLNGLGTASGMGLRGWMLKINVTVN